VSTFLILPAYGRVRKSFICIMLRVVEQRIFTYLACIPRAIADVLYFFMHTANFSSVYIPTSHFLVADSVPATHFLVVDSIPATHFLVVDSIPATHFLVTDSIPTTHFLIVDSIPAPHFLVVDGIPATPRGSLVAVDLLTLAQEISFQGVAKKLVAQGCRVPALVRGVSRGIVKTEVRSLLQRVAHGVHGARELLQLLASALQLHRQLLGL
jgi:hypothetical protein